MKARFAILVLLTLGVMEFRYETTYPSAWDQVQLGMTRAELVEKLGEPTQDTGEIKGLFWRREGLLTTYELNVYQRSDSSAIIGLERRIGTTQHFHRKLLRFEHLDQPLTP